MKTNPIHLAIFVWLGCFNISTAVRADGLWIRGSHEPRFGILRTRTESEIEFDCWDPQRGLFERQSFAVDQVESFVRNFDAARLERLDPSQPQAYLDYCEELLPQAQDPIARELAVRLALIAAWKSSGALRKSSLRLLVTAARNESESDRFAQLEWLLGGHLEQEVGQPAKAPTDLSKETWLELIVAIRSGKQEIAARLLGPLEGSASVPSGWNLAELKRLNSLQQLSSKELAALIQMEWEIRAGMPSGRASGEWAQEALADRGPAILIPTLETACEMDPNESYYRNGQWTRESDPSRSK